MSALVILVLFFAENEMHKYVSFNSFGKSMCKHTKYMSKFHISTQILQENALFSGKITQLETIYTTAGRDGRD